MVQCAVLGFDVVEKKHQNLETLQSFLLSEWPIHKDFAAQFIARGKFFFGRSPESFLNTPFPQCKY
jgi:hypothetical protein